MEKEKEVDTSVLRLDTNPSTYESLASSHQYANIVPLLVSLDNSFFSVINIRATASYIKSLSCHRAHDPFQVAIKAFTN